MTTIEELKKTIADAEALVAIETEKIHAQKMEAARIEREAKYELERIAQREADQLHAEKFMTHANAIVAELIKLDFLDASVSMTDGNKFPTIHPRGEQVRSNVSLCFEVVYSGGSWHAHATGSKMVVGSYGESKTFPQKADGTFSYEKIAKAFAEKYEAKNAEARREANEKSAQAYNDAAVKTLINKFGTEAYKGANYKSLKNTSFSSAEYHSDNRGHGTSRVYGKDQIKVTIKNVSVEKAEKLLAFLKENDLL